MKSCASALLAILLLPTAACAAGTAPAMLLAKLSSLAGGDGVDCGIVALPASRDAAIRCATDATAADKPYRVAFQIQGVDTYTWQGAARDNEGRLWVVFYDSDSSSGAAASPSLGMLLCRELKFAADKDEPVDCTPSTGSH